MESIGTSASGGKGPRGAAGKVAEGIVPVSRFDGSELDGWDVMSTRNKGGIYRLSMASMDTKETATNGSATSDASLYVANQAFPVGVVFPSPKPGRDIGIDQVSVGGPRWNHTTCAIGDVSEMA